MTVGGIVLSGHTDVVPVDGQPWDTPPFDATLVGERLHGRGVTDMKSFSAIGLAFVPELLRRGLARPLHFALSYDEEVGCIGVRRLLADIVARGVKPAGCIVGEPTGMQVVVAHKGKRAHRCRVRGHEAHSSLTPLGVNAVQVACEIVTFLAQMARRFRERGGFDAAYDVPYTTVHVGLIRGGTALNIVSRDCQFDFEFRHLPFDDPDALLAEVKRFSATLLPEMHAVDPSTAYRVRSHLDAARVRLARRHRDRRARQGLQRRARVRQGFVRQRGGAFSHQRHSRDPLRTGAHRAGAPAQRVGRARTAGPVRGIHASPGRPRLRRVNPARSGARA